MPLAKDTAMPLDRRYGIVLMKSVYAAGILPELVVEILLNMRLRGGFTQAGQIGDYVGFLSASERSVLMKGLSRFDIHIMSRSKLF